MVLVSKDSNTFNILLIVYIMYYKMRIITIRVRDELKEKMKQYSHINWSEVIRKAIEERIRLEKSISRRKIDVERLKKPY